MVLREVPYLRFFVAVGCNSLNLSHSKEKEKKEKRKTSHLLSPPLSPFSRLFPLFPYFLPVLSPSQPLFFRFSLSSPPQSSVFSSSCVSCSHLHTSPYSSPHFSIGWLAVAVSCALISTLLHRRPSCPPQSVVSPCSDLHSFSTAGSRNPIFGRNVRGKCETMKKWGKESTEEGDRDPSHN